MADRHLHDRALWRAVDPSGNVATLETFGSQTWALRALVAGGSGGLTPIDTPERKWAERIRRIEESGIVIDRAEVAEGTRYTLRSAITRLEGHQ